MKKLYTPQQIADLLNVHLITVYRHVKSGKLRAHRFGRQYRIAEDDFERFVKDAKIFLT